MRKIKGHALSFLIAAALICGLSAPGILANAPSPAPQNVYDVTKAASGQGWKVVNRTATVVEEGGRKFLRLDEKAGDGEVWLEGVSFAAGTIEFDVRGKDVFQKSFLGAAFHGLDDRTFEAVYFRPFNFKSTDPARVVHAVQYVSHPDNTWQKLRAEKPEQYEKPVKPVPDPNGWFHARIVVEAVKISVYVDGATEPCLTVDSLSGRRTGLVGLMVGNGSGGDFADFKITPAAIDPNLPPAPAKPAAPQDIFQAAQSGDLNGVKALVEKDPALVKAKNAGGQTPLHVAAGTARLELAEYLLSKGADVNVQDNFHTAPLHIACAVEAPVEMVRLLVEKGADVNAVAKYTGKPLDIALEGSVTAAVDYLKSKGAETTPLTFETAKLAPSMFRIAYPWGMRNNVIVFSGPDGILLIDSGFSKRAVPALAKTIAGLAPGEVKYLINTHPHGDHIDANAVAPASAKILNAKNLDNSEFKDRISKSDAPFRGRGSEDFAAPYVMRFNGEEIRIIPNPGLHSPEDLIFYFPKLGVLCLGDLLLAGTCPAVADPVAYLAFLDKVLAAFPDGTTFVSGHGPDLSKAGLKKYRDDLAAMIDIVRKARAAGKSADDMVRDDILKAYKADYSFLDWIGPDSLIRRVARLAK